MRLTLGVLYTIVSLKACFIGLSGTFGLSFIGTFDVYIIHIGILEVKLQFSSVGSDATFILISPNSVNQSINSTLFEIYTPNQTKI